MDGGVPAPPLPAAPATPAASAAPAAPAASPPTAAPGLVGTLSGAAWPAPVTAERLVTRDVSARPSTTVAGTEEPGGGVASSVPDPSGAASAVPGGGMTPPDWPGWLCWPC